tara:strand:+ start:724 stop:1119 length:396 start_codon:yes stop_codon:yes gene_type:complete
MATLFYKDFDLDFAKNEFTDDISVKLNKQAIRQSIINIVLTRDRERPFSLSTLGGAVEDIIFESNERSIEYIDLEKRIKRSINKYEPRVNFRSMSIERDNTEATITITYDYLTPSIPNNTSDGVVITLQGQ